MKDISKTQFRLATRIIFGQQAMQADGGDSAAATAASCVLRRNEML